MVVSKPRASLKVRGREWSGAQAALAEVVVRVGMAPAHDSARLRLWPGSGLLGELVPSEKLEVSLGQEDALELVFSGTVDRVDAAPEAHSATALAPSSALSALAVSQSWVRTRAADILRDLAGDLDIEAVQADVTIDTWSAEANRPVWPQWVELARLCGAEVSSAPSGAVRVLPPSGPPATIRLQWSGAVLQWSLRRAPARPALAVVPHGAASESGAEKWHHLLRDPSGEDAAARTFGALRTRQAADGLSEAIEQAQERSTTRGQALLVGSPGLRAGAVFEITQGPEPAAGPWRALRVEHTLSAVQGFTTAVHFESASAGSAGNGGGL